MGNWYRVIKTIKGHRYLYEQRTWREGKHVRTESRYLGPAGDGKEADDTPEPQSKQPTPAQRRTSSYISNLADEVLTALTDETVVGYSLLPWSSERSPDDGVQVEFNEHVQTLIKNLRVTITEDEPEAYYSPLKDIINMPSPGMFFSTDDATATQNYYATLFHELAHWTKGKGRKQASILETFRGVQSYAKEELVAELSAMMLMKHYGLYKVIPRDHICYFKNWLSRCKKGSYMTSEERVSALRHARREARAAVLYLLKYI